MNMTLLNIASIASLAAVGIAVAGFVVVLFITVREMRRHRGRTAHKGWWEY